VNLGIRSTLSDMGQTIAENFCGAILHGTSFLAEVSTARAQASRN
jgi:phosphopentomutase